jgi:hypothetical protein
MPDPLPAVPENAPAPAPMERPAKPVKKTALKAKQLAQDSTVARPQEKKMPRPPRPQEKKMPRKPPEAPSQAGRKPRIRKVQIAEEPPTAEGELPVKRGRGRPKGRRSETC